jgi:ATP-dependent Lhr-like helicase
VFDYLRDRGALFVEEIARGTGIVPSQVRALLRELLPRGLVVADRIDAYSEDETTMQRALAEAHRPHGKLARRGREAAPQERWRASPIRRISSLEGDEQEQALATWCSILLDRYGMLCREVVELESLAPRWRDLLDVLSRAEMRGELRRGYFVEGLSGLQFARPDTAEALARHAVLLASDPTTPTLINATDPANLYGSNAPFDIPLLEGGTARLARVASSSLVMVAGRPVLIVEANGKRLTGLASASEAELAAACGLLSTLCHARRPILRVETYNSGSVLASPIVPLLEQAGFVHDYPGMSYYARW